MSNAGTAYHNLAAIGSDALAEMLPTRTPLYISSKIKAQNE